MSVVIPSSSAKVRNHEAKLERNLQTCKHDEVADEDVLPIMFRPENDDRVENFALFLDILWEVLAVEMRRLSARLPALNVADRMAYLRQLCLGPHRNLIRAIATSLPYDPNGRFILYAHLTADNTLCEPSNEAQVHTIEDILEVLHDNPGEGVIMRGYCTQVTVPECEPSWHSHITAPSLQVPLPLACNNPLFASTPVFGSRPFDVDISVNVTHNDTQSTFADPDEQSIRIASLEQELAKLRDQMMMIVKAKESGNTPPKCQSPSSSDSGLDEDHHHTIKPPSRPQPPMAPIGVPPPPPPPPPQMLMSKPTPAKITPRKSKNTKAPTEPKEEHANTFANVMAEMQSGASRLRPVRNRSPGGTPSRKRRSITSQPPINPELDPAAYLAAALQKKFACLHIEDSPASEMAAGDAANDCSWLSNADDDL